MKPGKLYKVLAVSLGYLNKEGELKYLKFGEIVLYVGQSTEFFLMEKFITKEGKICMLVFSQIEHLWPLEHKFNV